MLDPREKSSEPRSQGAEEDEQDDSPNDLPDPTRYGDWEVGGRCIDF